jgi:subtilisin-like proprotein convertase family protein
MGDFGAGDVGTLTSWSISVSYITGVPSTAATWSPTGGLFTDPSALPAFAYTGDARDTVWARPTPAGVYTYQVTVQSLPVPPLAFANAAPITINAAGNATPYPSNVVVSGLPTTGVSVKSVTISGITHTWSEDVDILLQSPSGQNVILMSDIGGATPYNATYTLDDAAPTSMAGANPPPSGTYKPTNNVGIIGAEPDNWPAPGPGAVAQPNPTLSTFTGNMNGTWKLFVFDDAAGDAGSIAGFSVNFNLGIPACTSPARTVVVTVNSPTTVTLQPVNQTICTDKVATFTVAGGGSGPFSYQWQVSTNGNNPPWTNITNGGVYSGATTATLTITAPPVSMSGYFYRAIITGAAPCASATSFAARLIVNPLPTVVIAPVYSALMPGMTATLTSTVTPSAASSYTWIRDGVTLTSSSAGVLSGIGTGTLKVDVDGMGLYTLRVTDVNGCTNTSNSAIVKDSASGRCFIYPNPNSGTFQVRYYSVANNVLPRGIVVYDAKGDRVFLQNYTVGRPYDRMDVDMRAYGKGLYWVEIVDNNGNRLTMCRVVIQ